MTTLRPVLATVVAAIALAGTVSASHAQNTRHVSLQRGVMAAGLERCQPGMLGTQSLQTAAALGAFASPVVQRLLPNPDEATVLVMACAHQIHQQRCAASIVSVMGDLMLSTYPGLDVLPPGPNIGAVAGATVGGLLGLNQGGDSLVLKLGSAALLGYAGAQIGSSLWEGRKAAACMGRQRQLDAIGGQLQGTLSDASPAALSALVTANLHAGHLNAQDAATLVREASRLMVRVPQVLSAMR